jgi:predicted ribosome quality control (RQC) complex YloA/Tae2 family protein
VAELVRELAPLAVGRSLATLVPVVPRDLLLVFEDDSGEALRLRLSADPDLPRLHLQRAREPRGDGPVGPFFRRVAAELEGARLRALEQLARDRAVALVFEGGREGTRTLVLELFGRRANLILLGPGERVIEALVPDGPKTERLAPGRPWEAPGGAVKPLPEGARLAAALEALPPSVPHSVAAHPLAPLSWLVETRLAPVVAEKARERDVRDLRARLERRSERAASLVRGLERRAVAAAGAERVRLDGELLKLALGSLRRGLESVALEDVFDPEAPRRILALDPRRSPSENVAAYFERYKKLARAEESVALELARAREKLAALERSLAELAAEDADPAALEQRAQAAGLLEERQEADPRKRRAPQPRLPYRSFTALRGSEVRVGRSAKDNDELTLRHSRGNDLWLHTADAPGSHVVLRLERGAEPDPEELLDAAHLAAHFSPLRDSTRVAVHVAPRKAVHKPRGAKPGLVTLSGGRVLTVRVQPERLARLLGKDRHAAGDSQDGS